LGKKDKKKIFGNKKAFSKEGLYIHGDEGLVRIQMPRKRELK